MVARGRPPFGQRSLAEVDRLRSEITSLMEELDWTPAGLAFQLVDARIGPHALAPDLTLVLPREGQALCPGCELRNRLEEDAVVPARQS